MLVTRIVFNKLAPGAKQIMERYMHVTLPPVEARSRHGFLRAHQPRLLWGSLVRA